MFFSLIAVLYFPMARFVTTNVFDKTHIAENIKITFNCLF